MIADILIILETKRTSLLSIQSLFFYPGIVLSACWTVLNIIKMINYKG